MEFLLIWLYLSGMIATYFMYMMYMARTKNVLPFWRRVLNMALWPLSVWGVFVMWMILLHRSRKMQKKLAEEFANMTPEEMVNKVQEMVNDLREQGVLPNDS